MLALLRFIATAWNWAICASSPSRRHRVPHARVVHGRQELARLLDFQHLHREERAVAAVGREDRFRPEHLLQRAKEPVG
jgi:hypothetical protein